MRRRRNGVVIEIPGQRQRMPRVRSKKQTTDFHYKTWAMMCKIRKEHGRKLEDWAIVPVAHDDFKRLKREGWVIVEVWDKVRDNGDKAVAR